MRALDRRDLRRSGGEGCRGPSRWRLACAGLLGVAFAGLIVGGGCSDEHVATRSDARASVDSAKQGFDASRDILADQAEADQTQVDQGVKTCTGSRVYHPATRHCVSTVDVGADCADAKGVCKAACLEGQTCVTYETATGDFCTCAIACGPGPKHLCPEGYTCKWTSDTPKVCSPL